MPSDWLKQHAAAEEELTTTLLVYFSSQRRRIVTALAGHGRLTRGAGRDAFHIKNETAALLKIVAPKIVATMYQGAASKYRKPRRAKPRTKKDFPDEATFDTSAFDLPDGIKAAIKANWLDLEAQPFWLEIQKATASRLTDLISTAIDEGLNGRAMANKINEALGGFSKIRAAAIARTETTGAFNSGHQAAYDELKSDGTATTKKWLSLLDSDTRATHVALNGSEVPIDGDFNVGGTKAPFPGHWSLPAAQRVRCRCTTVVGATSL